MVGFHLQNSQGMCFILHHSGNESEKYSPKGDYMSSSLIYWIRDFLLTIVRLQKYSTKQHQTHF